MRPGARLCVSDLRQTRTLSPRRLAAGDGVALRFGACCPRLETGEVLATEDGSATLRVGGEAWRLARCSDGSGTRLPGLVSQNWFVVERVR